MFRGSDILRVETFEIGRHVLGKPGRTSDVLRHEQIDAIVHVESLVEKWDVRREDSEQQPQYRRPACSKTFVTRKHAGLQTFTIKHEFLAGLERIFSPTKLAVSTISRHRFWLPPSPPNTMNAIAKEILSCRERLGPSRIAGREVSRYRVSRCAGRPQEAS